MTANEHRHTWVSGMCYVSDEDVRKVAEMRAAIGESLPECETCGEEYQLEDATGRLNANLDAVAAAIKGMKRQ